MLELGCVAQFNLHNWFMKWEFSRLRNQFVTVFIVTDSKALNSSLDPYLKLDDSQLCGF